MTMSAYVCLCLPLFTLMYNYLRANYLCSDYSVWQQCSIGQHSSRARIEQRARNHQFQACGGVGVGVGEAYQ
jgi:hypothetical protein